MSNQYLEAYFYFLSILIRCFPLCVRQGGHVCACEQVHVKARDWCVMSMSVSFSPPFVFVFVFVMFCCCLQFPFAGLEVFYFLPAFICVFIDFFKDFYSFPL